MIEAKAKMHDLQDKNRRLQAALFELEAQRAEAQAAADRMAAQLKESSQSQQQRGNNGVGGGPSMDLAAAPPPGRRPSRGRASASISFGDGGRPGSHGGSNAMAGGASFEAAWEELNDLNSKSQIIVGDVGRCATERHFSLLSFASTVEQCFSPACDASSRM